MKSIESLIKEVEEKWLSKLYSFCKGLFTGNKIPSHDHTHHLRVWNYAREILFALNQTIKINYKLVEGTLIACMFHDTGLTITLGEYHGIESKKICERYFQENKLNKPSNFEEVLIAIELHDDKDYKQIISDPASILPVLCNADDLDAFGRVGVIRYTEIYLLRGINTSDLSKKVIQNLDKRFANFEKTYGFLPDLYNNHKERYLITRRFFEELLKEFI